MRKGLPNISIYHRCVLNYKGIKDFIFCTAMNTSTTKIKRVLRKFGKGSKNSFNENISTIKKINSQIYKQNLLMIILNLPKTTKENAVIQNEILIYKKEFITYSIKKNEIRTIFAQNKHFNLYNKTQSTFKIFFSIKLLEKLLQKSYLLNLKACQTCKFSKRADICTSYYFIIILDSILVDYDTQFLLTCMSLYRKYACMSQTTLISAETYIKYLFDPTSYIYLKTFLYFVISKIIQNTEILFFYLSANFAKSQIIVLNFLQDVLHRKYLSSKDILIIFLQLKCQVIDFQTNRLANLYNFFKFHLLLVNPCYDFFMCVFMVIQLLSSISTDAKIVFTNSENSILNFTTNFENRFYTNFYFLQNLIFYIKIIQALKYSSNGLRIVRFKLNEEILELYINNYSFDFYNSITNHNVDFLFILQEIEKMHFKYVLMLKGFTRFRNSRKSRFDYKSYILRLINHKDFKNNKQKIVYFTNLNIRCKKIFSTRFVIKEHQNRLESNKALYITKYRLFSKDITLNCVHIYQIYHYGVKYTPSTLLWKKFTLILKSMGYNLNDFYTNTIINFNNKLNRICITKNISCFKHHIRLTKQPSHKNLKNGSQMVLKISNIFRVTQSSYNNPIFVYIGSVKTCVNRFYRYKPIIISMFRTTNEQKPYSLSNNWYPQINQYNFLKFGLWWNVFRSKIFFNSILKFLRVSKGERINKYASGFFEHILSKSMEFIFDIAEQNLQSEELYENNCEYGYAFFYDSSKKVCGQLKRNRYAKIRSKKKKTNYFVYDWHQSYKINDKFSDKKHKRLHKTRRKIYNKKSSLKVFSNKKSYRKRASHKSESEYKINCQKNQLCKDNLLHQIMGRRRFFTNKNFILLENKSRRKYNCYSNSWVINSIRESTSHPNKHKYTKSIHNSKELFAYLEYPKTRDKKDVYLQGHSKSKFNAFFLHYNKIPQCNKLKQLSLQKSHVQNFENLINAIPLHDFVLRRFHDLSIIIFKETLEKPLCQIFISNFIKPDTRQAILYFISTKNLLEFKLLFIEANTCMGFSNPVCSMFSCSQLRHFHNCEHLMETQQACFYEKTKNVICKFLIAKNRYKTTLDFFLIRYLFTRLLCKNSAKNCFIKSKKHKSLRNLEIKKAHDYIHLRFQNTTIQADILLFERELFKFHIVKKPRIKRVVLENLKKLRKVFSKTSNILGASYENFFKILKGLDLCVWILNHLTIYSMPTNINMNHIEPENPKKFTNMYIYEVFFLKGINCSISKYKHVYLHSFIFVTSCNTTKINSVKFDYKFQLKKTHLFQNNLYILNSKCKSNFYATTINVQNREKQKEQMRIRKYKIGFQYFLFLAISKAIYYFIVEKVDFISCFLIFIRNSKRIFLIKNESQNCKLNNIILKCAKTFSIFLFDAMLLYMDLNNVFHLKIILFPNLTKKITEITCPKISLRGFFKYKKHHATGDICTLYDLFNRYTLFKGYSRRFKISFKQNSIFDFRETIYRKLNMLVYDHILENIYVCLILIHDVSQSLQTEINDYFKPFKNSFHGIRCIETFSMSFEPRQNSFLLHNEVISCLLNSLLRANYPDNIFFNKKAIKKVFKILKSLLERAENPDCATNLELETLKNHFFINNINENKFIRSQKNQIKNIYRNNTNLKHIRKFSKTLYRKISHQNTSLLISKCSHRFFKSKKWPFISHNVCKLSFLKLHNTSKTICFIEAIYHILSFVFQNVDFKIILEECVSNVKQFNTSDVLFFAVPKTQCVNPVLVLKKQKIIPLMFPNILAKDLSGFYSYYSILYRSNLLYLLYILRFDNPKILSCFSNNLKLENMFDKENTNFLNYRKLKKYTVITVPMLLLNRNFRTGGDVSCIRKFFMIYLLNYKSANIRNRFEKELQSILHILHTQKLTNLFSKSIHFFYKRCGIKSSTKHLISKRIHFFNQGCVNESTKKHLISKRIPFFNQVYSIKSTTKHLISKRIPFFNQGYSIKSTTKHFISKRIPFFNQGCAIKSTTKHLISKRIHFFNQGYGIKSTTKHFISKRIHFFNQGCVNKSITKNLIQNRIHFFYKACLDKSITKIYTCKKYSDYYSKIFGAPCFSIQTDILENKPKPAFPKIEYCYYSEKVARPLYIYIFYPKDKKSLNSKKQEVDILVTANIYLKVPSYNNLYHFDCINPKKYIENHLLIRVNHWRHPKYSFSIHKIIKYSSSNNINNEFGMIWGRIYIFLAFLEPKCTEFQAIISCNKHKSIEIFEELSYMYADRIFWCIILFICKYIFHIITIIVLKFLNSNNKKTLVDQNFVYDFSFFHKLCSDIKNTHINRKFYNKNVNIRKWNHESTYLEIEKIFHLNEFEKEVVSSSKINSACGFCYFVGYVKNENHLKAKNQSNSISYYFLRILPGNFYEFFLKNYYTDIKNQLNSMPYLFLNILLKNFYEFLLKNYYSDIKNQRNSAKYKKPQTLSNENTRYDFTLIELNTTNFSVSESKYKFTSYTLLVEDSEFITYFSRFLLRTDAETLGFCLPNIESIHKSYSPENYSDFLNLRSKYPNKKTKDNFLIFEIFFILKNEKMISESILSIKEVLNFSKLIIIVTTLKLKHPNIVEFCFHNLHTINNVLMDYLKKLSSHLPRFQKFYSSITTHALFSGQLLLKNIKFGINYPIPSNPITFRIQRKRVNAFIEAMTSNIFVYYHLDNKQKLNDDIIKFCRILCILIYNESHPWVTNILFHESIKKKNAGLYICCSEACAKNNGYICSVINSIKDVFYLNFVNYISMRSFSKEKKQDDNIQTSRSLIIHINKIKSGDFYTNIMFLLQTNNIIEVYLDRYISHVLMRKSEQKSLHSTKCFFYITKQINSYRLFCLTNENMYKNTQTCKIPFLDALRIFKLNKKDVKPHLLCFIKETFCNTNICKVRKQSLIRSIANRNFFITTTDCEKITTHENSSRAFQLGGYFFYKNLNPFKYSSTERKEISRDFYNHSLRHPLGKNNCFLCVISLSESLNNQRVLQNTFLSIYGLAIVFLRELARHSLCVFFRNFLFKFCTLIYFHIQVSKNSLKIDYNAKVRNQLHFYVVFRLGFCFLFGGHHYIFLAGNKNYRVIGLFNCNTKYTTINASCNFRSFLSKYRFMFIFLPVTRLLKNHNFVFDKPQKSEVFDKNNILWPTKLHKIKIYYEKCNCIPIIVSFLEIFSTKSFYRKVINELYSNSLLKITNLSSQNHIQMPEIVYKLFILFSRNKEMAYFNIERNSLLKIGYILQYLIMLTKILELDFYCLCNLILFDTKKHNIYARNSNIIKMLKCFCAGPSDIKNYLILFKHILSDCFQKHFLNDSFIYLKDLQNSFSIESLHELLKIKTVKKKNRVIDGFKRLFYHVKIIKECEILRNFIFEFNSVWKLDFVFLKNDEESGFKENPLESDQQKNEEVQKETRKGNTESNQEKSISENRSYRDTEGNQQDPSFKYEPYNIRMANIYIDTYPEALLIVHAFRLRLFSRSKTRLRIDERDKIKNGNVFCFVESEAIRRWTDGKIWSPSKILGQFLMYKEVPKNQSKSAIKKQRKEQKERMISQIDDLQKINRFSEVEGLSEEINSFRTLISGLSKNDDQYIKNVQSSQSYTSTKPETSDSNTDEKVIKTSIYGTKDPNIDQKNRLELESSDSKVGSKIYYSKNIPNGNLYDFRYSAENESSFNPKYLQKSIVNLPDPKTRSSYATVVKNSEVFKDFDFNRPAIIYQNGIPLAKNQTDKYSLLYGKKRPSTFYYAQHNSLLRERYKNMSIKLDERCMNLQESFEFYKKTISITIEKSCYHLISYFQKFFYKKNLLDIRFFAKLNESLEKIPQLTSDRGLLEEFEKLGVDINSIREKYPNSTNLELLDRISDRNFGILLKKFNIELPNNNNMFRSTWPKKVEDAAWGLCFLKRKKDNPN